MLGIFGMLVTGIQLYPFDNISTESWHDWGDFLLLFYYLKYHDNLAANIVLESKFMLPYINKPKNLV
jgi:hypothetical protein